MKFDFYIPYSWHLFPFVLLVGRGSHTHFPLPPDKLPRSVAQQVYKAILEYDILRLTVRSLMVLP